MASALSILPCADITRKRGIWSTLSLDPGRRIAFPHHGGGSRTMNRVGPFFVASSLAWNLAAMEVPPRGFWPAIRIDQQVLPPSCNDLLATGLSKGYLENLKTTTCLSRLRGVTIYYLCKPLAAYLFGCKAFQRSCDQIMSLVVANTPSVISLW